MRESVEKLLLGEKRVDVETKKARITAYWVPQMNPILRIDIKEKKACGLTKNSTPA